MLYVGEIYLYGMQYSPYTAMSRGKKLLSEFGNPQEVRDNYELCLLQTNISSQERYTSCKHYNL